MTRKDTTTGPLKEDTVSALKIEIAIVPEPDAALSKIGIPEVLKASIVAKIRSPIATVELEIVRA